MANLRRPTREVRIRILGMWTVPYPKINISLASFRRASGSGGWVGPIIPFRPERPNLASPSPNMHRDKISRSGDPLTLI